jgi:hypothetical protein
MDSWLTPKIHRFFNVSLNLGDDIMNTSRKNFLLSSFLFTHGITHAQTQRNSQSRTLKLWEDEDTRFSKKCTIDLAYTRLWFVFEEIYKQTGIKIESSDNSNILGEEVSFFAFDIPVIQILESIKSMLSFRNGECFWIRNKKEGTFRYQLERSSATVLYGKNYDYYLRGEILNALEEQITNVEKSTEERKKIAEKSGEYFSFDMEMTQKKIRAFGDLTTPEQRRKMIFSDQYMRTDFSDTKKLSESCRQYFDLIKKTYQNTSSTFTWGNLKEMSVYVEPKEEDILPVLWINMQSDLEGGAGYGVTGGTTTLQLLKNKILTEWILDNDISSSKKEESIIKQDQNSKSLKIPITYYDSTNKINAIPKNWDTNFETACRNISKQSNIPIFIRIPRIHSPILSYKGIQKIGDFTESLSKSVQVIHKWHNDSLIICPIAWFKIDQPEKKPTGSVMSVIINARKNNADQKLNLDDLIKIINISTISALERMIQKGLLPCTSLYEWKYLLASIGNNQTLKKAILSQGGVTFDSIDKQSQAKIQELLNKKIKPDGYVRLREELDEQRSPVPDTQRNVSGFLFKNLIIECRADLNRPFEKVSALMMDFQALPLS